MIRSQVTNFIRLVIRTLIYFFENYSGDLCNDSRKVLNPERPFTIFLEAIYSLFLTLFFFFYLNYMQFKMCNTTFYFVTLWKLWRLRSYHDIGGEMCMKFCQSFKSQVSLRLYHSSDIRMSFYKGILRMYVSKKWQNPLPAPYCANALRSFKLE